MFWYEAMVHHLHVVSSHNREILVAQTGNPRIFGFDLPRSAYLHGHRGAWRIEEFLLPCSFSRARQGPDQPIGGA